MNQLERDQFFALGVPLVNGPDLTADSLDDILAAAAFILDGRACGYPDCCIIDFLQRRFHATSFRPLPVQSAAGQNSGFVPCPACARSVMDGLPLSQLISATRQLEPFVTPSPAASAPAAKKKRRRKATKRRSTK